MKTDSGPTGVTFAVQKVERATKPLPTCKTHEALNRLLDRPVEACCDYTSDCVQGGRTGRKVHGPAGTRLPRIPVQLGYRPLGAQGGWTCWERLRDGPLL